MNELAPTDGQTKEAAGLECRECGCRHFDVINTYRQSGRIIRRRACRYCGKRITTSEKIIA